MIKTGTPKYASDWGTKYKMKRVRNRIRKLAAFCISILLLLGQLSAVYAADLPVMIPLEAAGASADGESDSAAVGVSGLRVTDVDMPVPGMPLDTSATVTSAEGVQWEIPVMWVDEAGGLAEGTAEDRLYFPVLVFFVPDGYTVLDTDSATDTFRICIDESLSGLFGENLLTVWIAEHGFFLIFPGSVNLDAVLSRLAGSSYPAQQQNSGTAVSAERTDKGETTDGGGAVPGGMDGFDTDQFDRSSELDELVDIHCSCEAVMRLGTEQLKTLVDLIINRLEPQAVNLLMTSFLTFQAAGDNGGMSREIGLYIYYGKGDNDGYPEHEDTLDGSVAYIWARHDQEPDQTIRFRYLLCVDASHLSYINDTGEAVLNLENEETAVLLENTIVHEMMHALTYDFLRSGMCGAVRAEDLFVDENLSGEEKEKAIARQTELYKATRFPAWFIEGLGSAVENVYQYRHDTFQLLRYDSDLSALTTDFSGKGILKAYLTEAFPGDSQDGLITYDLENAGQNEDSLRANLSNMPAKYVTGYLACLYLAGLTAYDWKTEKTYAGIGEKLRSGDYLYGLNTIMERLHEGETLDSLIRTVSGGRYSDTDDFEKKFIKGTSTGSGTDQVWQGDEDSLLFCSDFLNNMLSIDNKESSAHYANGSVLFEFDRDFETPLDRTKEAEYHLYTIADSNQAVESTVPEETAMAGGGKSRSRSDELAAGETGSSGTAAGKPLIPAAGAAKQAEKQTAKNAAEPAEAEEETTISEAVWESMAEPGNSHPATEAQNCVEQNGVEQNNAEQGGAEQNSAEQGSAGQNGAEQGSAGQNGTEQPAADTAPAGQSAAEGAASDSASAEQNSVEQNISGQNGTEMNGAEQAAADAAPAGQSAAGGAASDSASTEQNSVEQNISGQNGTEVNGAEQAAADAAPAGQNNGEQNVAEQNTPEEDREGGD